MVMKLPALSINIEEYEKELYDVIQNEESVVFLDTNILSFLYKINASARKEFYTWIHKIEGRCFIPKWNAHEYMKKVLSKQDDEYLGEIKKASEAAKSFIDNMKYVRMYIDDNVLKGSASYNSTNEYIEELESVEKSLQKLMNVIKSHKTAKIVRQEIKQHFEDKILKTDIYTIVRDIEEHGQNRYHCNLPPGFMDAKKEFNSYGDLVMWIEILNYCKTNQKKHCLLISRDVKKDFVYNVDVGKNSCKLTDERLKDEFMVNTDSDQFYVIDIERLVSILSRKEPDSFEALAKAVQIIDISDRGKDNDAESNDVCHDENMDAQQSHVCAEAEFESKEVGSSDVEQNPVSDNIASHEDEIITVSDEALQDVKFVADSDEGIVAIIGALKSHTWPIQNRAIDKLDSILKELNRLNLDRCQLDALFVLGRNIYQAACGNSFSAIQYLHGIDNNLSTFSVKIRNHIVCGALFEIFFNSNGEIREEYKYRYSTSVLALDKEKYAAAFCFIGNKLLQYNDTHIVYNQYTDQDAIVFEVSLEKENPDSSYDYYVKGIKIGGKSIQIQSTGILLLTRKIEQSSFASELAQMYCLPEEKVRISYNLNINKDFMLAIKGRLTTKYLDK